MYDDFEIEIQVLNVALDEAEELRTALNNEVEYLSKRCRMLEEILTVNGISFSCIDSLLEAD